MVPDSLMRFLAAPCSFVTAKSIFSRQERIVHLEKATLYITCLTPQF